MIFTKAVHDKINRPGEVGDRSEGNVFIWNNTALNFAKGFDTDYFKQRITRRDLFFDAFLVPIRIPSFASTLYSASRFLDSLHSFDNDDVAHADFFFI